MTTTMTAPPRTNGSRAPANNLPAVGNEKEMQYVPHGSADPIKLNVNIVRTLCAARTKKGCLASDDDALKFMMLCRARKLNPFEGDAFLVGYDGKDGPVFSLITAHQAFLKRAELHPEYDGMESGVVVQDEHGNAVDREGDFTFPNELVLGGWARVYFKSRRHPMYKRLALFARRKDTSIWNTDTAGMICKCAEADALRSSFPTMLGGLYLAEEQFPVAEVVATEPKQIELTPGRQKISGTRKPTKRGETVQTPENDAPQVHEDPVPEAQVDDGSQPEAQEPTADDIEAQEAIDQKFDEIATAIDGAADQKQLTDAGAQLKAALPMLGEDRHKALMGKWQAKFQQFQPPKKR